MGLMNIIKVFWGCCVVKSLRKNTAMQKVQIWQSQIYLALKGQQYEISEPSEEK